MGIRHDFSGFFNQFPGLIVFFFYCALARMFLCHFKFAQYSMIFDIEYFKMIKDIFTVIFRFSSSVDPVSRYTQ